MTTKEERRREYLLFRLYNSCHRLEKSIMDAEDLDSINAALTEHEKIIEEFKNTFAMSYQPARM